jgi:ATP-binding cassette, subfamily C (CFTR/MRP), member 1
MCLASLNPVLSFAGFVGLSSSSSGLTISQALTSLSILALLNRPLSNLSVALTSLAGAVASFDRIQDYLNGDEKVDKRLTSRPTTGSTSLPNNEKSSTVQEEDAHNETANSEKTAVDEKDAPLPPGIMATVDGTLTWPGTEKPTLTIHDLSIPSAAVTLLLGPTGCGKTTLLNTILGEMPLFEGTIRMASLNTSYCAQKSWLPSGTIREAIVGTLEVDEDWYARTVAASALLPDLAALPEGDGSLLGNKGTSLSGGQKQRLVSIFLHSPPFVFRCCFVAGRVLTDCISHVAGYCKSRLC